MNQRLDKLTSWLIEEHIDAAFITSTENVFYLTGFHCEPHERLLGLFVFQNEEPILICPKMEEVKVRDAGWNYRTIAYTDNDHPWEMIHHAISQYDITISILAVEKEHLNVGRYEVLREMFLETGFVSAEEKLHSLRLLKDDKELKALREAAAMADEAIEIGVASIKEGRSELEILSIVETEIKKKGINKFSFNTMVLTGENTAAPHGIPGLNKVEKGNFVLFDLGVVIDGYCSDISRTVAFGSVTGAQKDIYYSVLKAQIAALEACKPGVRIGELDQISRTIISEAGYGEYFTHRLGHGLGIGVHEFPSIIDSNNLPLEPGMCFTIEPGIYKPSVGGVRIEDDVFITKDGVEILTKYPKELIIL